MDKVQRDATWVYKPTPDVPVKELIALLSEKMKPHGKTVSQDLRVLFGYLEDDNPDALLLAMDLLKKGSARANLLVIITLELAANEIQESVEYAVRENDENQWKSYCYDLWDETLRHHMIAAWNLGELANEGVQEASDLHQYLATKLESAITQIDRFDYLLNHKNYQSDRSADLQYWRGVAIVSLLQGDWLLTHDRDDIKTFVDWAGRTKRDASAIISLANERDLIDTKVLEALLSEQELSPTALRGGAL